MTAIRIRRAALAAIVLTCALTASVAHAQTCLEDLAGSVGCTANDVKIATMSLRPAA